MTSAALAVGATGALSISIPLLLLSGGQHRSASVVANEPVTAHAVQLRACDGQSLPADPVLHPGDCVLLRTAGFTAAERVKIRRWSRPGWVSVVTAQAAGQLDYRLVIASQSHVGHDVISFLGLGTAAQASCDFTVSQS